jgi:hypothetical protein
MDFVSAAPLVLIGCPVGFNSANTQGAFMKATQTTKILAIGTINPGFEQSQVFAVLPEEVRETVDLYHEGKNKSELQEFRDMLIAVREISLSLRKQGRDRSCQAERCF